MKQLIIILLILVYVNSEKVYLPDSKCTQYEWEEVCITKTHGSYKNPCAWCKLIGVCVVYDPCSNKTINDNVPSICHNRENLVFDENAPTCFDVTRESNVPIIMFTLIACVINMVIFLTNIKIGLLDDQNCRCRIHPSVKNPWFFVMISITIGYFIITIYVFFRYYIADNLVTLNRINIVLIFIFFGQLILIGLSIIYTTKSGICHTTRRGYDAISDDDC